jgi:hypothetical protein
LRTAAEVFVTSPRPGASGVLAVPGHARTISPPPGPDAGAACAGVPVMIVGTTAASAIHLRIQSPPP